MARWNTVRDSVRVLIGAIIATLYVSNAFAVVQLPSYFPAQN
jgi:hypothetical protein